MKIKGIGIISQKEVSSVLSRDGLQAIKDGNMTWEEAGDLYKLQLVKKHSKIGSMSDTFNASISRIPEDVYDKLSPADIAALVDAFYDCYADGKAQKEKEL